MSVKTQHPTGRLDSSRRRKIRYIRRTQGKPNVVDANIVRNHINTLHSYGLGFSSIAQVAGCNDRTIRFIAEGRNATCYLYVAQGILAVTPIPDPRQDWVLRIGATRRIRALRRFGYALPDLDAHLGSGMARSIADGKGPTISYASWEKVKRLYECLSATPGPSGRATAHAVKQGWLSPWDWEAANIDDPLSYPPKVSGPSRGDLKRQAAALDGPHVTADDLAKKLGVTSRTIVRWRTERRNSGKEIGGV